MKSFESRSTLQCAECGSKNLEVSVDILISDYLPIEITCNHCGYMTEVARIEKQGILDHIEVKVGTADFSNKEEEC